MGTLGELEGELARLSDVPLSAGEWVRLGELSLQKSSISSACKEWFGVLLHTGYTYYIYTNVKCLNEV